MKKSKFIESEERTWYLKSLREFSQKINPKPSDEEIKKLKEQRLQDRLK